MKANKLLTVVLAVAIALALLSGAIAVPILCRPFYYAQIGPLGLSEQTGWDTATIKQAYDEVLDFCLWGGDFRVGGLLWSESGRDHFVDAAALFHLDFRLFFISVAVLVVCGGLLRWKRLTLWRPLKRGPCFWAGTGLATMFVLLGGLAATNFSAAFVIFHQLFFPGKDNWILDDRTDQIILLLPEAFFRNCAILAIGLLFIGCAALIAYDFVRYRKE